MSSSEIGTQTPYEVKFEEGMESFIEQRPRLVGRGVQLSIKNASQLIPSLAITFGTMMSIPRTSMVSVLALSVDQANDKPQQLTRLGQRFLIEVLLTGLLYKRLRFGVYWDVQSRGHLGSAKLVACGIIGRRVISCNSSIGRCLSIKFLLAMMGWECKGSKMHTRGDEDQMACSRQAR
ncbi:hypothetical protein BO78DRAFT_138670 [Aspergillus sclerotiicarbonarius CBS 121057]|uniref:Uncharacterized protein n=1 Tax=Aspergillus sclerotiicarbonarius (strain CBS 121057 / IBT 28362) TaxID=1448318 RepID=A0A319EDI5_ASPSB|nr:hypothetical protein BO78DRAFT_138670 [Aspergillus sclerotiicarbonarius CBS 121057]